ncbi:substrate-binding domain-containing protein [Prosthecomicrobium sp. N25]|uniref:substrate-binding domain-containing protein n=1 Tax=Prosthecomicrobium sp. N25 TaxID=3129254 RepID=UPI003077B2B7
MSDHRRALALLLAFALLWLAPSLGAAAQPYRFAIVPPTADSPFFQAIRDGCGERARQVTGVTCLYAAPGGEEKRSQAQLLRDLVKEGIDGIALSPDPTQETAQAIDEAVAAGVPVVTFDADLPRTRRQAFIGTNAKDFGRTLGQSVKRWKPKGGTFVILTADPTLPNLSERIAGIRDALSTGSWSEAKESPVVTDGTFVDAVRMMDQTLARRPDLDVVFSVGAWPMLAPEDWRAMVAKYKPRIDQAQTVLVVADALPAQKALVREGLGHVLVGQRPGDMGVKAVDLLLDLKKGRKVPEVVYVGFDTFTRLDLIKPGG